VSYLRAATFNGKSGDPAVKQMEAGRATKEIARELGVTDQMLAPE